MKNKKVDIVGDSHGYADVLDALLAEMGYEKVKGVWRHSERHLLLLGDLIDRGPEQLRTIDIARRMIDAGAASIVMGNHELNAIAWALRDPETGSFHRDHSPRNHEQHAAFLAAVGDGSALHREMIDFFLTMPLWSEFEDFRAVHACWHPEMQARLAGSVDADNAMTPEGVHRILRRGTPEFKAGEIVLKGLEVPLPEGLSYLDAQGVKRTITRIKWWDAQALSFRDSAIVEDDVRAGIPDEHLPPEALVSYDGAKPVFFGHYWMPGEPFLVSDKMACLDFSVAKDGFLCGYSYDGEEILDPAKLTWVGSVASLTP